MTNGDAYIRIYGWVNCIIFLPGDGFYHAGDRVIDNTCDALWSIGPTKTNLGETLAQRKTETCFPIKSYQDIDCKKNGHYDQTWMSDFFFLFWYKNGIILPEHLVTPLTVGRFGSNFLQHNSKTKLYTLELLLDSQNQPPWSAFMWMPENLTNEQMTLVSIMAWSLRQLVITQTSVD